MHKKNKTVNEVLLCKVSEDSKIMELLELPEFNLNRGEQPTNCPQNSIIPLMGISEQFPNLYDKV